MASLNKWTGIGNLGADPDVKFLQNGDAVTNISLATTESWKDSNGEKQSRAEWHRITFFRKLAEIAGEYLKKGSQVYIEGKLQTRKWTDKDNIDRYTTEIIANQMVMLGGRPGSSSNDSANAAEGERQYKNKDAGNVTYDIEDDTPF